MAFGELLTGIPAGRGSLPRFDMARLDLQRRLEALLGQVGSVDTGQMRPARQFVFPRHLIETLIYPVYRELGGLLEHAPMRPGDWDVEFGGIPIELDEETSFSRYRAKTLQSDLYRRLPAFPLDEYGHYCAQYERECILAGS